MKFSQKILRIGDFEKLSFLSWPFWNFFFKKFFFASSSWKLVKPTWLSRMGQNFKDYPGFQPKITQPKHFSPQCTFHHIFCFSVRDVSKKGLCWQMNEILGSNGYVLLDQFRIMKAFLSLSSIGINKQKFAAKAHSSSIIELLNVQYEDNPCSCTLDPYW